MPLYYDIHEDVVSDAVSYAMPNASLKARDIVSMIVNESYLNDLSVLAFRNRLSWRPARFGVGLSFLLHMHHAHDERYVSIAKLLMDESGRYDSYIGDHFGEIVGAVRETVSYIEDIGPIIGVPSYQGIPFLIDYDNQMWLEALTYEDQFALAPREPFITNHLGTPDDAVSALEVVANSDNEIHELAFRSYGLHMDLLAHTLRRDEIEAFDGEKLLPVKERERSHDFHMKIASCALNSSFDFYRNNKNMAVYEMNMHLELYARPLVHHLGQTGFEIDKMSGLKMLGSYIGNLERIVE